MGGTSVSGPIAFRGRERKLVDGAVICDKMPNDDPAHDPEGDADIFEAM